MWWRILKIPATRAKFLQDYEQGLLDLAKAELPEARFEDTHFYYNNRRYDLRWNLAELNGSEFFACMPLNIFLPGNW